MRKVLLASILLIALHWLGGLIDNTNPGEAAAQVQPTVVPTFSTGTILIITADTLNLRSGPGVSYVVIGYLSNGDLVTVIDGPASVDGREWYDVSHEGNTGWVSAKYVALYVFPTEAMNVATSTNNPATSGVSSTPTSSSTPQKTNSTPSFPLQVIFFFGSIYWVLIIVRMGFVGLQESQRYGEKGTGCAYALIIFYAIILLSPLGRAIGFLIFSLVSGVMSLAIVTLNGLKVGSSLKRHSIKGILTCSLFLGSFGISVVNDRIGTIAYTAVLCLSLILSYREIKQLLNRVYGIGTGQYSNTDERYLRGVVFWPPLVLIQAVLDVGIFTYILPAGLTVGLQFLFTIIGVIVGYRKNIFG